MDEPVNSKLFLPCPLEIYTAEELQSINKAPSIWYNCYKDPIEPAKSWSKEVFTQVYSKPGFHFMIARTAQIGPQSRDPKLLSLQSKLSSRWSCQVDLTTMDPCQDWMLCTIPDTLGPQAEVLSAALIRLSNSNASYIVCHFGPLSCLHELKFTVKGSNTNANNIYNQLWKRQLDFKATSMSLGWCVMGVRKSDIVSKYWGSFILDSPSTFWPWAIQFDHAHGSIPPSTSLLNFDPVWTAQHPYACQICYNSDHTTYECLLPSIRLGGIPIVSHSSQTMVMHKKAAE